MSSVAYRPKMTEIFDQKQKLGRIDRAATAQFELRRAKLYCDWIS